MGVTPLKLADVKKMSRAERLQAMEALWDSLIYEGEEMETPKWHDKILEERKASIENGQARFISLEALRISIPG